MLPITRFAFLLQRKFAGNLETHDNPFMNDIHGIEGNLSWSSTSFLSPIGILSEPSDADRDAPSTPEFYIRALPHLVLVYFVVNRLVLCMFKLMPGASIVHVFSYDFFFSFTSFYFSI